MAVVTTVPMVVRFFLLNHIVNFYNTYDVDVVSNISENSSLLDILPKGVRKYNIPILREISLLSDIKALLLLARHFYVKKIMIVYSVSPKAGILSMTAARLVGVPVRIHTFTGQVWVEKKGVMRFLLKLIDRIIAKLASVVIVDSQSQRDYLIKNNIVSEEKSIVIGAGSISGVDVGRFELRPLVRKTVREKMGVVDHTVVFLYVGRLKRDKGLFELAKAFLSISKKTDNIALWFVGPDEDKIKDEIKMIMSECDNDVRFVPYTTKPEDYMMSSEIFCLPSYREGFGSTIIEAAACGVPSIGSRIYGIMDAIIDGETGILVEKASISGLAIAMQNIASDSRQREKLGKSAKKRALESFNQQLITDQLLLIIGRQVEKYT